jgi:hypothetical protein
MIEMELKTKTNLLKIKKYIEIKKKYLFYKQNKKTKEKEENTPRPK